MKGRWDFSKEIITPDADGSSYRFVETERHIGYEHIGTYTPLTDSIICKYSGFSNKLILYSKAWERRRIPVMWRHSLRQQLKKEMAKESGQEAVEPDF